MTSENRQFTSLTRDVGVLGWNTLLAWLRTEVWIYDFRLVPCQVFSVGVLSLLVDEQLLLRKASKIQEPAWTRESGSPVTGRGIILLLFSKRGGSRLSQNLTFREFPFNMEGMAMSQKRLQAHLHSLNLVWGRWPSHCPDSPHPKLGDCVLLAMHSPLLSFRFGLSSQTLP